MANHKPANFAVLRQQETGGEQQHVDELVRLTPKELPPTPRVAVIVCHGMGQQIPFETIDTVARVLRRASPSSPKAGATYPDVTTRIVDLGIDKAVPRAELNVADPSGGSVETHIYEVYWAPLPAGKVSLTAVARFLVGAGLSGIRASVVPFWRWLFQDWQQFPRSSRPFIQLVLALLFLSALIVMNATIVAVMAGYALGKGPPAWPSGDLLAAITADFALFALCALATGLALALTYWLHEHIDETEIGWDGSGPLGRLGVGGLNLLIWITLLIGIVVGFLLVWDLAASSTKQRLSWDIFSAWLGPARDFYGFSSGISWLVWATVIAASFYVRKFLVEYVGAVVVYVESHKVSEFWEIREQIQELALTLGRAVYAAAATDGDRLLYSRVVVVGHSLGSVVAYDMLNRLFLEDIWGDGDPRIRARTADLITFGSPLDKTAFIFRTQKPVPAVVREALAAGVQPVIAEVAFRKRLRWTNLWSSADWISGPLAYYDYSDADHLTPVPSWAVHNIQDQYAAIPLLAHVMYWRSPQFARSLVSAVLSQGANDTAARERDEAARAHKPA